MHKILFKLLFIGTLLFITAASAVTPATVPTSPKKNQSDLAAQVDALKGEVNKLQSRVFKLELATNNTAYIDPSEPDKYSRVDSDNGSFIVSLDTIEPYIDGQKVTLEIGSLYDASYKGFSLTITYGPRMPPLDTDSKSFSKWSDSLKKSDQDFTQTLYPGVWNKVVVVLAPLKAEDCGYINIVMHTNQISLGTYAPSGG